MEFIRNKYMNNPFNRINIFFLPFSLTKLLGKKGVRHSESFKRAFLTGNELPVFVIILKWEWMNDRFRFWMIQNHLLMTSRDNERKFQFVEHVIRYNLYGITYTGTSRLFWNIIIPYDMKHILVWCCIIKLVTSGV